MINHNRAVQFGQNVDQGQGELNQTLPGAFPFVTSDMDTFDQVKAVDPMGGYGIVIPAAVGAQPGQNVHYIRTAPDYIFKIKRLFFSVYDLLPAGTYTTQNQLGAAFYYDIGGDPQFAWCVPLTRYISLQFSVVSGGDRVIVGGNQMDQTSGAANAGQNYFVSLDSLQSDRYGTHSVFTPYMIPAESTVRFTLRNVFSSPLLVVGGMIGTRIRL
jgi:hypothetical protein